MNVCFQIANAQIFSTNKVILDNKLSHMYQNTRKNKYGIVINTILCIFMNAQSIANVIKNIVVSHFLIGN